MKEFQFISKYKYLIHFISSFTKNKFRLKGLKDTIDNSISQKLYSIIQMILCTKQSTKRVSIPHK